MKTISTLTAAAALALLAGCSGAEEPAAPPETNVVESLPEETTPPLPAPLPPAPEPVAPPVEPVPTPDPDQQVLDDADASGMTSRVDRNAEQGQTQTEELR